MEIITTNNRGNPPRCHRENGSEDRAVKEPLCAPAMRAPWIECAGSDGRDKQRETKGRHPVAQAYPHLPPCLFTAYPQIYPQAE